MTDETQQKETERRTTVIGFPWGEIRTSPEMARQYLDDVRAGKVNIKLDREDVFLGNGNFVDIASDRGRQYVKNMLTDQNTVDLKLDSVYQNTGIYDAARRTLPSILAKVTFTAGAFCMGIGALCSDWELFRNGMIVAVPSVAYYTGRQDEARIPSTQKNLLLKKLGE